MIDWICSRWERGIEGDQGILHAAQQAAHLHDAITELQARGVDPNSVINLLAPLQRVYLRSLLGTYPTKGDALKHQDTLFDDMDFRLTERELELGVRVARDPAAVRAVTAQLEALRARRLALRQKRTMEPAQVPVEKPAPRVVNGSLWDPPSGSTPTGGAQA